MNKLIECELCEQQSLNVSVPSPRTMLRALAVIVATACGTNAQTDSDLELLGRVRQHAKCEPRPTARLYVPGDNRAVDVRS
jgi:hypothetical protein